MHSVVLASSSPTQRKSLISRSESSSAPSYHVDLTQFDSKMAEAVIDYMYTGEFSSKDIWESHHYFELELLMITLGLDVKKLNAFPEICSRYLLT